MFRDPGSDGRHMFITARLKGAPRLDDGVIGHARSADMVHWELGPPLSSPAGFGQIEVPEGADGAGSADAGVHLSHRRTDLLAETTIGTALHLVGALRFPGRALGYQQCVALSGRARSLAAPFLQDRDGNWVLVGFVNLEPKGVNSFDIIDPIPVTLQDGVVVARPGYSSVEEALLAGRAHAPTTV